MSLLTKLCSSGQKRIIQKSRNRRNYCDAVDVTTCDVFSDVFNVVLCLSRTNASCVEIVVVDFFVVFVNVVVAVGDESPDQNRLFRRPDRATTLLNLFSSSPINR